MAAALPFIVAASAGVSAYSSIKQTQEIKRSRDDQKRAERERADELARETRAREAAKKRDETLGQRTGGFSGTGASVFSSGMGFGSGDSGRGLAQGTLFGN